MSEKNVNKNSKIKLIKNKIIGLKVSKKKP